MAGLEAKIERLPLPPGPKPWPIIGNLLDIPGEQPWLTYTRPMFIVSSVAVANDLMDKHSAIHPSKRASVMGNITGWDFNLAFMPYCMDIDGGAYRSRQQREVRAFLRRSLATQDICIDPKSICQTLATVLLDVLYTYKVKDMDDQLIRISVEAAEIINAGHASGAYWVDWLPFLQHVPGWLPGGGARRLADRCMPLVHTMLNAPFDAVKYGERREECVVLDLITKLEKENIDSTPEDQERYAKDAAGTAFSLLSWFYCSIATYPEIQHKAQQELREVVGTSRLPQFEDLEALPYVHAILLESIRWMPVLPLGIPHQSIADDYYDGYFIPKGTVIVPNVWAMLHDLYDYPEPYEFNPDRFWRNGAINPDVRDPLVAFGFGRRICPGRWFAKENAFLTMASVLHVFNVEPAVDEHGNRLDPRATPSTGIASYPDRLNCVLKVRSDEAEMLINKSASEM